MKADQFKTILLLLIPIIGLSFFYFAGKDKDENNRKNPDEAAAFESRLKDSDTSNLETLSKSLSQLETDIVEETNVDDDREVSEGDNITVNYIGWLASDGTVFDQSFNRGDAGFTFTVGSGVIEGWSEGVVGMKAGEIRRLYIPFEKAYGEEGSGTIPAKADLIFDVELIRFND